MLRRDQAAHPQAASPLFSVIPPEIRNLIFRLAFRGYPDRIRGYYPGNAFYCRPGYEHDRRIDTALLLTCRRVYDETRLLPVIENEHVFWYDRGPPRSSADPTRYFRKMAEEQQNVVDCVHFFTQQYLLEGRFPGSCAITEMRPRKLKITVRESDWWWFELNQSLVLKDKWTDGIRLLKRLEEFEMELETIERDKDQMLAIAQRISEWKIELWDGRVLSTEGCSLVHDQWRGTSVFENRWTWYDWESNAWTNRPGIIGPGAPLVYHTVIVKWTAVAKV